MVPRTRLSVAAAGIGRVDGSGALLIGPAVGSHIVRTAERRRSEKRCNQNQPRTRASCLHHLSVAGKPGPNCVFGHRVYSERSEESPVHLALKKLRAAPFEPPDRKCTGDPSPSKPALSERSESNGRLRIDYGYCSSSKSASDRGSSSSASGRSRSSRVG